MSVAGGESDFENPSPTRGVAGLHGAAVTAADPGADPKAEPGAVLAALAPAFGTPEALEQLVRVVGRQPGAVVAHLEPHGAVLAVDGDLDRRARGRVDERVAEQVGEHLTELVGVAGDRDR